MIRKDCKFYEWNRCKALKRLYCRNEKCVFYKKSCKDELIENQIKTDFNNKKSDVVEVISTNSQLIKEVSKCIQNSRLSKECKVKMQNIKNQNEVQYINYGVLEFSDNEINLLKKGKLKIR